MDFYGFEIAKNRITWRTDDGEKHIMLNRCIAASHDVACQKISDGEIKKSIEAEKKEILSAYGKEEKKEIKKKLETKDFIKEATQRATNRLTAEGAAEIGTATYNEAVLSVFAFAKKLYDDNAKFIS